MDSDVEWSNVSEDQWDVQICPNTCSDGLCDNDVLEVDGIDIGGGCPRSGELWCGGTCCVVQGEDVEGSVAVQLDGGGAGHNVGGVIHGHVVNRERQRWRI